MPEGKEAETTAIVAAVGAVIEKVPVYQDALQPGLQQVGSALNTSGALLNLALRPIKSSTLVGALLFDRLDDLIREKLAGTPAEKIVEPPPYVTGQVLLQLPFVAEEAHLRDLYVQLLANAMHADRTQTVHPSYIDLIRQMTPDEGRLLPLLRGGRHWPIVEVRFAKEGVPGWGHEEAIAGLDVEPTMLKAPKMFGVYFRNLERAKVLAVDFTKHLTDDRQYAYIMEGSQMKHCEARAAAAGAKLLFQKGIIELTEYGSGFIEACLPPAHDPGREVPRPNATPGRM